MNTSRRQNHLGTWCAGRSRGRPHAHPEAGDDSVAGQGTNQAAQLLAVVVLFRLQSRRVEQSPCEGEQVSTGDTIVVLEAMKMEQPISAHKSGTVTGLDVQLGQTVSAGHTICRLAD